MFEWFLRLFGSGDAKAKSVPSGARPRQSGPSTPPAGRPAKPSAATEQARPHRCAFCDPNVAGPQPKARAPQFVEALRARIVEVFPTIATELPLFSPTAVRLFELVEHPQVEMNELVTVINREPVITSDVLRTANSSFYRGTSEIVSIRDAVVRMGLREVARVAAASSARSIFDLEARSAGGLFTDVRKALWISSLASANAAGWGAMTYRAAVDQSYLGGMLSGVGKAAVLHVLAILTMRREVMPPEKLRMLKPRTEGKPVDHEDIQMAVNADLPFILDATSPSLGKQMAEICQFPKAIRPVFETPAKSTTDSREVRIVWLVLQLGEILDGRGGPEVPKLARHLGLTCTAVQELSSYLKEARKKAESQAGG